MTVDSRVAYASPSPGPAGTGGGLRPWFEWKHLLVVAILAVLYRQSGREIYQIWVMADSYYSHGFLVPLLSLGIAWTRRNELRNAPRDVSAAGFVWLVGGLFLMLLGDFLGFRVFAHVSIVPILAGLIMLLYGKTAARLLWFPLFFLLFMVPIPPSLTQSVTLHLKLIAAELAVRLARLMTLPMVREGSYIHFGQDKLLIGEVCGGLRSLISLLAVGALATYFSRTRPWARAVLLGMTVPIAIVANVVRIFLLCVVGYFWGSDFAAGRFHDISGIVIFVTAFALFFALEAYLRRVAPQAEPEEGKPAEAPPPRPGARPRRTVVALFAVSVMLLLGTYGAHAAILKSQGVSSAPKEVEFDIPAQIGRFKQRGQDAPISERIMTKLETSSIMSRLYTEPHGWPVELTIVYAGRTRRSIHFPEVCMTGDGWDILEQKGRQVGFLFEAKQLVLVKGDNRQAVLYWFKTGDVLTGNYFLNALYWAKNQVTSGSPTSAMVKLACPIPPGPGGEDAAFSVLEEFALRFTPVLRESVP